MTERERRSKGGYSDCSSRVVDDGAVSVRGTPEWSRHTLRSLALAACAANDSISSSARYRRFVAGGRRILIFMSRRVLLPSSSTFIVFLMSGTLSTTLVFPPLAPLVQYM